MLSKEWLKSGVVLTHHLLSLGGAEWCEAERSRVNWPTLWIDPGSKQRQPAGIQVNWQPCAPP